MKINAGWFKRFMNLYPPYLGAGIRVKFISADFRQIRVGMKLRWYNRNYVKTHFGGSLYAMTDPFFMLMLIRILGRDYIVWDQAATITFRKPGKGTVSVLFEITDDMLRDVREQTETGHPYRPVWVVHVMDAAGEVVAVVSKTLYIRRRNKS